MMHRPRLLALLAGLLLAASCSKSGTPNQPPDEAQANDQAQDQAPAKDDNAGAAPTRPGVRYTATQGAHRLELVVENRDEQRIGFALSERGPSGCEVSLEGEATLKDGDMESRDDSEGNAYFVAEYTYQSEGCGAAIAIDLDTRALAWASVWDCPSVAASCALAGDDPVGPLAAEPTKSSAGAAPAAGFAAHARAFPAASIPLALPPDAKELAAIRGRPATDELARAHVCSGRDFDCQADLAGAQVFRGYRWNISNALVGLIYYIDAKDRDVFLLVVCDQDGRAIDSRMIAETASGRGFGYAGGIEADATISQNRYVQSGDEREFVEDRSFRVVDTGRIDQVI